MYWYEKELNDEGLDIRVYNLGVPGETTEGLLARFEQETKSRERKGFEDVFLFAYGMNDCAFLPKENKFAVAIEQFEQNLATAIIKAKKFGGRIFLLTINPVVETATAIPKDNGKSRLNAYVDDYNKRIEKVAASESVSLIDVNAEFKKREYTTLLSPDGLHPNAEGHKAIFELIKGLDV